MPLEPPAAMRAALLVLLAIAGGSARAETRGTIRVGILPLDLESSADTPLFGTHVQDAVDDFNAAASARGMSTRIDASDVGIAETVYTLAPGLEVGAGRYMFRIEGVFGLADGLTSLGVGVYPLGIQGKLGRRTTLYGSAGGIASWLDRSGAGDIGGLVAARLALGARIADRLLVEVGYNAFVLGGNFNRARLDAMTSGAEMSTELDAAIAAGEARGLVDVSVGVAF